MQSIAIALHRVALALHRVALALQGIALGLHPSSQNPDKKSIDTLVQNDRSMVFSERVDRPHPQVQELCAEPANAPIQWRQMSLKRSTEVMYVRCNGIVVLPKQSYSLH